MKKMRKTLGFTMAEMLIVVAIIAVLAGVSFIAVQNHQRDLALMERDSIAKEIFIAAQNHLTMADSQGYMGMDLSGLTATSVLRETEAGKTIYDLIYNGTDQPMLDALLPFGSIDETVRAGGRYVIRYQLNPARVLDVFYWTTNGDSQYGTTQFSGSVSYKEDEAKAILALGEDSQRGNRKKNNPVIGWFGGESALTSGDYEIQAPEIEVENAEKLIVKVKDTNTGYRDTSGNNLSALKLIIEGEKSEAKKAYTLELTGTDYEYDNVTGVYNVTLDDITNPEGQFANIVADTTAKFIPGEDITVYAVAFSNQTLSNIAYSARITTNSIFGELQEDDDGNGTAIISNIRHLENLDKGVSNLDGNDSDDLLNISSALQIDDLIWEEDSSVEDSTAFVNRIDTTGVVRIYGYNSATALTIGDDSYYYPVNIDYPMTYSGGYHTITNVKVKTEDDEADVGLFAAVVGTNSEPCTISNLELIDFNISGTGNAGALAGTMTYCTVTNVLAYNNTNSTDIGIETTSGGAGGLIGSATSCTISKSAAALIVSSTGGNAGGLVGTMEGGTVTGCFSGGHTVDKSLTGSTNPVVGYDSDSYNVTASVTAGGLIGDAMATDIKYCYSTCSATGATVGGLVGSATGSIQYSYCTGLVSGTTEGAFAGTYSGTATDCSYFEIINERKETYTNASGAAVETGGYIYLDPVSGSETVTGITAMDATASTFNKFSNPGTTDYTWQSAIPYNDMLTKYYGEGSGTSREAKYILKTVAQLALLDSLNTEFAVQGEPGESDNPQIPADFVIQHYGDWPAPEIFVVNTK